MSHFAKVQNGIVVEVLVIAQDVIDTGMKKLYHGKKYQSKTTK